jgi:hypothetical protein
MTRSKSILRGSKNTHLSLEDEQRFQHDFREIAKRTGVSPNPDSGDYDYRGRGRSVTGAWKTSCKATMRSDGKPNPRRSGQLMPDEIQTRPKRSRWPQRWTVTVGLCSRATADPARGQVATIAWLSTRSPTTYTGGSCDGAGPWSWSRNSPASTVAGGCADGAPREPCK